MRDFRLTSSQPLAVAIATSCRPSLLERTLNSLAECHKPASYEGAWIVENGETNGIRQLVGKYAVEHRFRYLHVAEANKSHALNTLLARAGDALLFFTDDDVRFDSHILTAYEEAATGVVEGQFYGGPLDVDYDVSPPPAWMKRMLPKTACGWSRSEDRITCLPRPRFLGPNWAAFASDLRRIGGFDTRLGPGSQANCTGDETEIQRRLSRAGAEGYYVPQAMAWHFIRSEVITEKWILERALRHGREWGIDHARRFPRGTIERYARLRLRWATFAERLLKTNRRSAQSQLQAAYKIAKWQGRIEGLAIGYGWHALPPIQPLPSTRRVAA